MVNEETHLSENSVNEGMEKEEHDEVGENEEFYETIEAPKFVDLTVADYQRPDDRYWFCLRVGCDQKHEEEMDSEAIYKNFVLRVMAARSPNVRLHKALNRNCSSKTVKCPLSAPPKSSKSRLCRLAIISSISQKMDENKVKVKPPSKVCSTPKAKDKPVAAKYLTTSRNKKGTANPNAFRSVQDTKPPSVVVPKSRMVAKTLNFQSPKKAFSVKTSVELRTPLTKLCEKMKKLEITSQRKPASANTSKYSKQLGHHSQKALPVHTSARQKSSCNDKCRRKISQKITQQSNQHASSLRSLKGKSIGKLSKQSSMKEVCCADETEAKSRDEDHRYKDHPVKEETACPILSGPSSDASKGELNSSTKPLHTNMAADDIPTAQASIKEENEIQAKVEEESIGVVKVTLGGQQNSDKVSPEYAVSLGKGCESDTTHNDDKENASALNENRGFSHKNDYSGKSILGIQKSDRRKVVEAVDKDRKGQATNGAPGVKLMKLKPTNPKPFKLRTDERGILREANLERKIHAVAPQKEAAIVSRFQGRDLWGQLVDTQKGIASVKPRKQQVKTKTPTGQKTHQSKQQELKPTTPTYESNTRQELEHVSKKKISSSEHVLDESQRHLYVTPEAMTPDKTLSATVNTSSGSLKSKEIGKQQRRKFSGVPASSPGPLSRGRMTIPKEPNFLRSHVPKSCTAKIS